MSLRSLAVVVAVCGCLGPASCLFARQQPSPPTADPAKSSTDENDADKPGTDATGDKDESDLPAGHSQHGEAFNAGPRQKAYLMAGTGKVRFAVTSEQPQVQAFIEQGIGQVHGFWYFEAERSFRQAARLDPDCAMAYWGMALANANNRKRSQQFIAEAVKRKASASEREQLYIDALDQYLNAKLSTKKKAVALIEAYEKLSEAYPDDLEAKAFLAYTLYKKRSSAGKKYEDVDAALQVVLDAEPMHPVHHFRIHLWDYKDAKKALPSAARCGQSAPSIAHMWHMPGHIYSRLKRYQDAVWQQEASARVDHAQMMRDRVLPDQIHNFAHNNEWLVRSLTYVGRWEDAADLAQNMIELPQHPRYNTITRRGSAYYGRLRLFDVLHKFERWDQLIAAATGRFLVPTSKDAEQVKRLRYLGIAYARANQTEQAETVLLELQKRLRTAGSSSTSARPPRGSRSRSRSNPRQALERAIAAIQGHQAIAAGDFKAALPLLKSASEDRLLQARVQSLAGDAKGALRAAESYMRSQQKRAQPLAGYVELLWQAGEREKAAEVFKQLREVSSAIQLGSPVFDRLQPIAKELGLEGDWRVEAKLPDDVGQRPSLDSLGPFRWQPLPAKPWTLKDLAGKTRSLEQYQGKPVIVIFYLGYGCLHCVEQLQAFAPMAKKFQDAGIELIAISTDPQKDLRRSLENYEGGMPFSLVSDASLEVFKQYNVFDDFEDVPLHGTFLIDRQGLVRWQDISYEPFMDANFLLLESKRLLGQTAQPFTALAAGVEREKRREAAIKRRIDPAGISGSLLLLNEESPTDAVERFHDLARREQARVVIIQAGEGQQAQAVELRKDLSERRVTSLESFISPAGDPIDDKSFREALKAATAVWLLAEQAEPLRRLLAGPLGKQLGELSQRGGVVAGQGLVAAHLAGVVLDPTASGGVAPVGLGLLPDAVVEVTGKAAQQADWATTLAEFPGTVGLTIESGAGVIVRGRRVAALGAGAVHVHLAGGAKRPARNWTLEGRRQADLTALRNSAVARLQAPFPAAKPPAPKVPKGSLIIIGGGGMPKGIIDDFVKRAGGDEAKIIVLPTAMPDPIRPQSGIAEAFRKAGAGKVTVLPGRTLATVESDEYQAALREATGIWFGGGRQWRFADAYLGTKALDLMHQTLERGGVIMGSSAGASIQADYLARANPLGNRDIMAEGYERGLGFLRGVAIDQHFAQRKRFADMTSLVSRYPQLLGIGIDEGTAIIVEGQIAKVVGKSQVHFYDRKKTVKEGEPDYESVKADGRYDLVARKVVDPGGEQSPATAKDSATATTEPVPAAASTPTPRTPADKIRRYADGLLKKYDTDQNGKLDAAEQANMRRQPKSADRNKDGVLTIDELVQWLTPAKP